MWPFNRTPKPEFTVGCAYDDGSPKIGQWRFARLDGRFVFDYDDGRKGFASPSFYDVDPFAEYVTTLEQELEAARRELEAIFDHHTGEPHWGGLCPWMDEALTRHAARTAERE